MSNDGALNHAELLAFADALDVAENAATGREIIALALLSRMIQADPLSSLSVIVGFMGASILTLAEVSGVTPEAMVTELRARGAL